MEDKIHFSTPLKIKTSKQDVAPIGFFFDIYSIDTFSLPISPIPMRIDKIYRTQPSLFITPKLEILKDFLLTSAYDIDWEKFYYQGIINLINYGKKKIWEVSHHLLGKDLVLKWFLKSKSISAEISSLQDDLTYHYIEFVKVINQIKSNDLKFEDGAYREALIDYCDKMIDYFVKRLENNVIVINHNDSDYEQSIYKEKRGKAYPSLILIKVKKTGKKQATSKMCFVPYLIYDDIIDSFTYNKKLLIEGDLRYINISDLESNGIIIKGSKIDNYNSVDMFENIFEHVHTNLEKKL